MSEPDFTEGSVFDSFQNLRLAISDLETATNVVISIKRSTKLNPSYYSSEVQEIFKYSSITYECKHGSFRKTRSQGIRPNQKTQKLGCHFFFTLTIKKIGDKHKLVVTKCCLEHSNHVPTAEAVLLLPERRKLQIDLSLEVLAADLSVDISDEQLKEKKKLLALLKKDLYNLKNKIEVISEAIEIIEQICKDTPVDNWRRNQKK